MFIVVGVGRRDKDDSAFREDVRKSLAAAHADAPSEEVDGFLGRVFYHRADFTTAEGPGRARHAARRTGSGARAAGQPALLPGDRPGVLRPPRRGARGQRADARRTGTGGRGW